MQYSFIPMADPKLERQPPKNKRRDPENPLVYFDVSIGGQSAGKIVFELFKDVVPKVRCFPPITASK